MQIGRKYSRGPAARTVELHCDVQLLSINTLLQQNTLNRISYVLLFYGAHILIKDVSSRRLGEGVLLSGTKQITVHSQSRIH